MTKKVISLALVLITILSTFAITASAASTKAFDFLTSSKYAKTYTIPTSGRTIPYTNKNLNTRGTATYGASSSSYIDNRSDEIYIVDVGCTNGKYWAYVSYPTSSKRVYAYINLSAITKNNGSHEKTISTGKFFCSTRENTSNSSSYYVAKGDAVYLVATSGSKYQIMYPISGGLWRLAWCNKSDYQKYCAPKKATTTTPSIPAGFTDVTSYFAGQKITIKSVQNGKFLCADADVSNTPLKANRTKAATWETFTVTSLTSDGWVGFKAAVNGKYLTANRDVSNAPIRATASKLQSWECFRVYQKGKDFYVKAQANGKWLSTRTDTSGAPVQACAATPSGWERFNISISGQGQYITIAEIIKTATENGLKANSSAYKALLSVNSKYSSKLSSTDKKGTVVFMFEGVGNNSSASKRMNAMCVLVKNGDVVFLNRNCSTIPDYPFTPSKNGGDPMPTLKSGVYNFSTVNHRGYAALNVNGAKVVRHKSQKSYFNCTSSQINVHRRSTDNIAPSTDNWVNSAGCLIIGKSGKASSDEYASFIKTVGIVGKNATGTTPKSNPISGKIVVDRAYAGTYLSNVGYSSGAISAIG